MVACLGLARLCASGAAHAQGLTAPLVGTQISGPATPDAAAVFFNPAQLAYAKEPELLAGGLLVLADIEYRRERRAIYQREDSLDFALPIEPDAVDASKTGWAKRETSHPVGVAPTLFGVYPFGGGRFGVGLGIYAPFAAQASFNPRGAQRFSLEKGSIAALFGTAAVSYRPMRAVAFGAGISYVFGVAELWRVQDFAGLADVGAGLAGPPVNQANDFGPNAPPGVRELDAMARPIAIRNAIANAATFNLGVASEPLRGVRLGLAYQHKTRMYFRGPFTLDMDNDFFTQDLEKQGLKYPPRVRGDAEIALTLPSSIKAGASWQVSRRIGVGLNATYAFWSQLESIKVTVRSPDLAQPQLGLPDRSVVDFPRRFKNTIGADLVVRAEVTPGLSLWAPVGYRSAAAPDSTIDASTPDGDRLVFGFGGALQLSPRYALLGDANFQTIVPRRVVGSDNDLGNGKYWLNILTLGLALRVRFGERHETVSFPPK
jgi:long-chain fatty acid transport protein